MSHHNQFRHQAYPSDPVLPPSFHKLKVTDGDLTDFTSLHTEFRVNHVVLVHGTFMGDDPFAISETLNAVAGSASLLKKPLESLAAKLKERVKPLTDGVTGDVGNYGDDFRNLFQQLVGDDPVVELMQPTWTGQNHHFARADLAVLLLCQLDKLQPAHNDCILLWGHSHAGNGFAILTNLLANEPTSVEAFFRAAAQDLPHWQQAEKILKDAPSPHPLARCVRIAAFGTPVRYGWDASGCSDLVHVLHHGGQEPEDSITTKPMFPPHSATDMVTAQFGDWVQAFGIAGTDLTPPTSSAVNERMAAVLEADLAAPDHGLDTKFLAPARIRDLCARWKTGTRCHATGRNLLLVYEPSGRKTGLGFPIEHAMLGHGVATTTNWLPAHLALVMQSLQPAP
jgi:hypothetical protein